MQHEPHTLVLDAGGVLIAEPIPELLAGMAGAGRSDPAAVQSFFYAELYVPLWSGALAKDDFWRLLLEVSRAPGTAAQWEDYFVSRLVPRPAAGRVAEWRATADRLVVLSNHLREWLHPALAATGTDGLFDAVLVSSQTGHVKPDISAYLDLVPAGVSLTERTLMVDDRRDNVDAARSLGMDGLLAGADPGWLDEVTKWLRD